MGATRPGGQGRSSPAGRKAAPGGRRGVSSPGPMATRRRCRRRMSPRLRTPPQGRRIRSAAGCRRLAGDQAIRRAEDQRQQHDHDAGKGQDHADQPRHRLLGGRRAAPVAVALRVPGVSSARSRAGRRTRVVAAAASMATSSAGSCSASNSGSGTGSGSKSGSGCGAGPAGSEPIHRGTGLAAMGPAAIAGRGPGSGTDSLTRVRRRARWARIHQRLTERRWRPRPSCRSLRVPAPALARALTRAPALARALTRAPGSGSGSGSRFWFRGF